jgi:ribonuclease-3
MSDPDATPSPHRTGLALIDQALTHKSWAVEHGGPHNERLEFLGDAVLKLLAVEFLYEQRPEHTEGKLSGMLHQLVQNPNLARLSRELGLGAALRLGRGEERTGGRERESILANTFEALLAVVYLSDGLDGARRVVRHAYAGELPRVEHLRHPVNELQEHTQAQAGVLPDYAVVGRTGSDHSPTFHVEISLNGTLLAKGEGSSKPTAKAAAAAAALKSLLGGDRA